jgi:hypothetical protein
MGITCPAWAGGAASSAFSIGGGVLLAQVSQAPAAAPSSGPTFLEGAGIASIIVGIVTAIGTQMKPVIEGYFADRKHQRELESLDIANDLAHATQRIRLLEAQAKALATLEAHKDQEVAHWRVQVQNNQSLIATLKEEIASMRRHWNDPVAPPPKEPHLKDVPPLPDPPEIPEDVFPAIEKSGVPPS